MDFGGDCKRRPLYAVADVESLLPVAGLVLEVLCCSRRGPGVRMRCRHVCCPYMPDMADEGIDELDLCLCMVCLGLQFLRLACL